MISNLADLDAAIRNVNMEAPAGLLFVQLDYDSGKRQATLSFKLDGTEIDGIVDHFGGEYADTDGRILNALIGERMVALGFS